MKRIIGLIILLSARLLVAQENPQVNVVRVEKPVTKVIPLKNARNVSTNILDGMDLTVRRSGDIVVVTGPPERVETAEAILKQLDVPAPPRPPVAPRKSIELTGYLITASVSGPQGTPVPKDLESPVHQVASVFPYKQFNLLDAIDLRLTDGAGGQVKGVLPGGGQYELSVDHLNMFEQPADSLMRIAKFNLIINNVKLETDIDMKEGQKVVVGKVNVDSTSNALIVILTARIAD